jgi:hypothetical protein
MWRWVRMKNTTIGISTITLIVMNPGQSVENSAHRNSRLCLRYGP